MHRSCKCRSFAIAQPLWGAITRFDGRMCSDASGGVLALEAAARGLPMAKLAVYEPPFNLEESAHSPRGLGVRPEATPTPRPATRNSFAGPDVHRIAAEEDAMVGQARLRVDGHLLAVALLAAACSSGGRGRPSPEPPTSPTGSPTTSEASSPGPGAFVRACETSVYGDLGKGWREDRSAVVVGPLALLYPGSYANAPRRFFIRYGTGYHSQKVLAVVEQGAVVTVAVAPAATGVASLLYDPERFNHSGGYEVSDGERAVTFKACAKGTALIGPPNSATQFPGGFIVAGPQSVPLEIWVGNNRTPMHRVLSFATGDCARHLP